MVAFEIPEYLGGNGWLWYVYFVGLPCYGCWMSHGHATWAHKTPFYLFSWPFGALAGGSCHMGTFGWCFTRWGPIVSLGHLGQPSFWPKSMTWLLAMSVWPWFATLFWLSTLVLIGPNGLNMKAMHWFPMAALVLEASSLGCLVLACLGPSS